MRTLELVILLLLILTIIAIIALSLYLYEINKVKKLVSKQLVASNTIKEII